MKRNIISIAAAGVLATAISVLAAGSPAAFAAPFNGVSGEGYQCESGSRDPDPIPYNDRRCCQQGFGMGFVYGR